MVFKFCPECGFKFDREYKFCPECGFSLNGLANGDANNSGMQNGFVPTFDTSATFNPSATFEADVQNFRFDSSAFLSQPQQNFDPTEGRLSFANDSFDQADDGLAGFASAFDKEIAKSGEKKKAVDLAKVYCIRGKYDDAVKIFDGMIKDDFMDIDGHVGRFRVLTKNYTVFDENVQCEYNAILQVFSKQQLLNADKDFAKIDDLIKKDLEAKQIKAQKDEVANRKKRIKQKFVQDSKLTKKGTIIHFGMWPASEKQEGVTILGNLDSENCFYGDDDCVYEKVGERYFKFEPLRWIPYWDTDIKLSGTEGYITSCMLDVITFKMYTGMGVRYNHSSLQNFMSVVFPKKAFEPFGVDMLDGDVKIEKEGRHTYYTGDVSYSVSGLSLSDYVRKKEYEYVCEVAHPPKESSLHFNKLGYGEKENLYVKTKSPYVWAKLNQVYRATGKFVPEVAKTRFWSGETTYKDKHYAKIICEKAPHYGEISPEEYAGVVPVIHLEKEVCKKKFGIEWR